MNHTIQQYEDGQSKEPILKIWREINAREEREQAPQSLEDSESQSSQTENVN